jgi:oxygen-dependent protoporphyrinogen oxidase
VAKTELIAERFKPPRRGFADESIDAFARRRAGREVAATLADAFVTGILAGDPRLLSVQAAFPRLAAYERDHGSVQSGFAAARKQRRQAGSATARARTWSFKGGLGVLVDTLASSLRTKVQTGVGVRRVLPLENGWRVEGEGRDGWDADAVVLACPAYRQAEVLGDLDADLAGRVGSIAYNRVAVVALGYRREDVPHSLDGFGYLSRQRERRDVLGAQWCSSIFPGRAPDGTVLMRALCGGWNRGEVVDWPEERLVGAVRAEMAKAVGVTAPPRFCQVTRWPRAIPQYFVGHLDRVAAIEKRVSRYSGLFVGGSAYRGVAINDCVEQASALAGRVTAWWRGRGAWPVEGEPS